MIYSHVILSCYYRRSVDRDYSKMTEQDCSQVVTHYGGNKFGNLTDVDVGPNGEVIVVDHNNNCVVVLDNKLNLLRVIGRGSGESRLYGPDGVAVTDNVIAISNWGSHQVKKYSLQGEFLSVIGCPAAGNKKGQFNRPRGLAFNSNKLLYVVDRGNCRVQVFQQDNNFVSVFGKKGSNPGEFQSPVVIAIDLNDNVLVTDHIAQCINLFDHHNKFIRKFGCHNVYAILISPTGYLISGHRGDDNKIKVWYPGTEYNLIHEFGKKGFKQGEFNGIMGMAMSSTGVIYVVEWNSMRIQVISSN